MTYYIKQLVTQDYASIKDIFCQTFLKEDIPVSCLGYRWRNRSRENSFGIFTSSGDLLGFALISDGRHLQVQQLEKDKKVSNTPNRYLSFLAVHPAYRGANLGSELLSVILAKTITDNKSICLYPLDNTKLKDWYKRYGFNPSPKEFFNFHIHNTRNQGAHLKRYAV
jgi:ribosomal protein S18 acetylase RimI-like enzyme